ncbi:MAG: FecR family protein [Candidatus Omnitrophica bacterium]|nr:FecR family protein [Candidatus Omnitrophota bacterium]
MKRIGIFFILFHMILFCACVYAQSARVIDLKGPVLVKEGLGPDWGEAKLNMLLDKDAEVQTKKNARCTLAFDEEQKNIVTIKEDSRIKIESVDPGEIFLLEGRVFSLIEDLAKTKTEKFEIRTPTAVAGVRGTGWITDFHNGVSSILCFLDTVYTQGLDEDGNVTGEEDTPGGQGRSVGPDGSVGDAGPLGDADYGEWNGFMGYLDGLFGGEEDGDDGGTGEGDIGDEEFGDGDMGSLEDLAMEQREDYSDIMDHTRRQDLEGSGGSSSQDDSPRDSIQY